MITKPVAIATKNLRAGSAQRLEVRDWFRFLASREQTRRLRRTGTFLSCEKFRLALVEDGL